MTKYIAIYGEYGDNGGYFEHTAEVDCNDDLESIYKAFKEYGLNDYDFSEATFYKISKEFYGSDMIVDTKVGNE